MNTKQAKRTRAYAYKEAERQGLWKKGEEGVYTKWYRRILARFFPKLRKKYADAIGRWYKSTLKRWSKEAYASIHDRDAQAFARARAKMQASDRKKRIAKQLAKV
jgi:hypothetical protein